jgi:hypothetical protein
MSTSLLCVHATWPGRLDVEVLGGAIDTIIDNPWQRLAEMAADTSEQRRLSWQPFERSGALDVIERERRALFLRTGSEAGAIEAQVWSDAYDSSLILYVPPVIDARLREQVARQVQSLPDGAYGTVFSTLAQTTTASLVLPVHLAAAPWAVWLPPTAAAQLFDAQKLSALDYAERQVLPDGTLWLQLFADPLNPSLSDLLLALTKLESTLK